MLSVVIASHSDPDLPATLASLRATAPDVEAICVDDCSVRPVASDWAKVIRTQRRIGVGPARTLGAMHATGEYLLFTDAHMRFPSGWYESAMSRVVGRPKTIHCGACHDFGTPGSPYMRGATWNFYGRDQTGRAFQVFECIWNRNPPDAPLKSPHIPLPDDSQIAAIMGAVYCIPRDWFFQLAPLRFLKSWGCDEQSLSLKAWLSGGECRLLNTHPIAHRFQQGNSPYRIPFRLNEADTRYNKMFLIHTILPTNRAAVLLSKFPRDRFTREAVLRIETDWGLIEGEKERNRQLFTRSFDSFLEQFQIPFPER